MATITVHEVGSTRRLRLNALQRRLFTRELARVRRGRFDRRPPRGVAPDCRIVVRDAGRDTIYELYGRAVIFDTRRRRSWQFYFGLLLLEWLGAVP